MTTEHHPSDVVLFALAAGTLDETQRVETATHVRECASCRAFVRAMEHVGGIVLEESASDVHGERIIVGIARADRAT